MGRSEHGSIPHDKLPLTVLAKLDNFQLLENLVGRLAYRKNRNTFIQETPGLDYRNLESSSVEAYVSGNFFLSGNNESLHIPFTSCFFFTCTRWKKGVDQLVWSNSLS